MEICPPLHPQRIEGEKLKSSLAYTLLITKLIIPSKPLTPHAHHLGTQLSWCTNLQGLNMYIQNQTYPIKLKGKNIYIGRVLYYNSQVIQLAYPSERKVILHIHVRKGTTIFTAQIAPHVTNIHSCTSGIVPAVTPWQQHTLLRQGSHQQVAQVTANQSHYLWIMLPLPAWHHSHHTHTWTTATYADYLYTLYTPTIQP